MRARCCTTVFYVTRRCLCVWYKIRSENAAETYFQPSCVTHRAYFSITFNEIMNFGIDYERKVRDKESSIDMQQEQFK